jgi:hypothetical protein
MWQWCAIRAARYFRFGCESPLLSSYGCFGLLQITHESATQLCGHLRAIMGSFMMVFLLAISGKSNANQALFTDLFDELRGSQKKHYNFTPRDARGKWGEDSS